MKVYDEMAEFYDLIYSDSLDLEFYLREARNARGPVLEVACGTGRILLRLVQEGIPASGIDLSQGMLDILREKAQDAGVDVDARLADMIDFSLGRKFRLIIVPYRSFLHLRDGESRKKALANFLSHLENGGRLILHTYNPSGEEMELQGGYHNYEREEIVSASGERYELLWYLHYEPGSRVGHYKIVMKKAGAEPREFLMDLSYVAAKEMESLLKSAGYRNIKRYCGFAYAPFSEDCKEVLWIAER